MGLQLWRMVRAAFKNYIFKRWLYFFEIISRDCLNASIFFQISIIDSVDFQNWKLLNFSFINYFFSSFCRKLLMQLFTFLLIYLCICSDIISSFRLFFHLFIHLFIYSFIYIFIYLIIYLFLYLFIYSFWCCSFYRYPESSLAFSSNSLLKNKMLRIENRKEYIEKTVFQVPEDRKSVV